MLPTQKPYQVNASFIPLDDYLALKLGTQVERIYTFDFLPFGFFGRLLVRLLHFTNHCCSWRDGLLFQYTVNPSNQSSNPSANTCLGSIEFEFSKELSIKVRGSNPGKLLRGIVENVDLLLAGWYKNTPTITVPFTLMGSLSFPLPSPPLPSILFLLPSFFCFILQSTPLPLLLINQDCLLLTGISSPPSSPFSFSFFLSFHSSVNSPLFASH